MFQIIFNEISAAEISQLDTLEQLDLLSQFKVTPDDLENIDGDRFGHSKHKGVELYRYRSEDYRIYFDLEDENVVVHRLLHKNSFQDFLYRSNLPSGEDEALAESKTFWKLIDEGRNAAAVSK